MDNRGNVLSVRQLSKYFILHILGGKVIAGCEEIGFDLKQGEFLGLTGPSGAGKSTVLKCIYRTYLPTSGQVLYTGKDGRQIDLVCAPEREMVRLRRREIGYVSQFLKVMPRVPAVDVLAGELRQKGWEMEDARQRAREFLKIMDINQALWDAYPSTFSGGEQQRVNLARAMITEPRLLLLDEPTASLDTATRQIVIRVLKDLKAAGATMIGVFHDLDVMGRLVDRVFSLKAGCEASPSLPGATNRARPDPLQRVPRPGAAACGRGSVPRPEGTRHGGPGTPALAGTDRASRKAGQDAQ